MRLSLSLPTHARTCCARLAASSRPRPRENVSLISTTRNKSSSPYGRSHVLHRRPPSLPAPCVPEFPQVVIRSDGSSYTHYTTSPRSLIRLTRDLTNNPMWNCSMWAGDMDADEKGEVAGRLGRFRRKFEGAEVDYDGLEMEGDWSEAVRAPKEIPKGRPKKK